MSIDELFGETRDALKLSLVAGRKGVSLTIEVPRIQKPGLALAGFLPQIHPDRIQVLGNTELAYLGTLGRVAARQAVRTLLGAGVACVVVTNGAEPPKYLREEADRARIPLFATALPSAHLIRGITRWLERRLAPRTQVHGALVEVFHLGALLLGKSGIGKSEAALELVTRGHRLVADDVVVVRREGPSDLIGSSDELLGHHLEIRGLGIVDIEALFGMLATLSECRVDLAIELAEWKEGDEIERLGLDEQTAPILEVGVPLVKIPVRPGRPIAVLVETAVRNQILKRHGFFSARELAARVDQAITPARKKAVRRDH
ncbi:MAG: HPr(Ser) kinase/phosphatase [Candidatus Binatia bacterium]